MFSSFLSMSVYYLCRMDMVILGSRSKWETEDLFNTRVDQAVDVLNLADY